MEVVKISIDGEIDNQYNELKFCPDIQRLIEGIRELIEHSFTSSAQTFSHLNRELEYKGKKYKIEVK